MLLRLSAFHVRAYMHGKDYIHINNAQKMTKSTEGLNVLNVSLLRRYFKKSRCSIKMCLNQIAFYDF